MCLFNYFQKDRKFTSPRFVYRGGPELGGESPPEDDWEKPDVSGMRQKELDAGRGRTGPDFKIPEKGPEQPKPIDPGMPVLESNGRPKEKLHERFPKLKEIIKKFEEIEDREFFNRDMTQLSGPYVEDFVSMTRKMKEAMLYQAITSNWSEETLYKQYEQAMKYLYTKAASRPVSAETWQLMKSAWRGLFKSENLGEGGMNTAIEGRRIISLRERPRIIAEMLKLENALLNGENVCVEWDGTCDERKAKKKLDGDRLEFIQDDLIPFYRNWFLNKGIVENKSDSDIYWAYAKALADFAHSCIKS